MRSVIQLNQEDIRQAIAYWLNEVEREGVKMEDVVLHHDCRSADVGGDLGTFSAEIEKPLRGLQR